MTSARSRRWQATGRLRNKLSVSPTPTRQPTPSVGSTQWSPSMPKKPHSLSRSRSGPRWSARSVFRRHIGNGIELGFWIGKPYWGRGYATEAARALVGYAFDKLGLTQIVAGAFRENRASRRVLEKVGFGKTTLAEVNWPHRGGHRRIQRYAITREKLRAA